MQTSDAPVVVTQSFDCDIETVWRAITELAEMQAWFFAEIREFKAEAGFETEFELQHEQKTYVHQWKILEASSPTKIVYDWRYRDLPGIGHVTWQLAAQQNQTTLTLTNSVVESFPDDDPAFHRDSAVDGWTYLIQQRLKEHLEGLSQNQ